MPVVNPIYSGDSSSSGNKPVSQLITLTTTQWLNGLDGNVTKTVSVDGVLKDEGAQLISVMPAATSRSVWEAAEIRCSGQAEGYLTFMATNKLTAAVQVYVVIQEVTAR